MRAIAIIAVCTTFVTSTAFASPPPVPPELQCEFESYVSATAAQGSPHFNVETHHESGADSVRYFEITPAAKFAYAEGSNVNNEYSYLVVGHQSWMFVEGFHFTDTDTNYFTVVFIQDEPGANQNAYRAVRSRQWTAGGAVYATQQYGTCKAIW
jgi:hypothetical protein